MMGHYPKNRHSRSRRAGQALIALLLCLCLFFCTAAADHESSSAAETGDASSEGESSSENMSESSSGTEAPTGPVDVPLLPFTDGVLTAEKSYVLITGSQTLNVRAQATTDSAVVAYMVKNAWCVYLDRATDNTGRTWYRVDTGAAAGSWDGTGYVSGNYAKSFSVAAGQNAYGAYLKALGFPDSYISSLTAMHERYPSWLFLPQQTRDCWAEALYQEANPASYPGINLVSIRSRSSWKATKNGAYDWTTSTWSTGYDGAAWTMASNEIVAYYLDPRNFLDDTSSIFMFLDQRYDASQTLEGVRSIVKGTFLAAESTTDANGSVFNYAEVIFNAGKTVGVNPYFLAASIRQEQGVAGTSKSISGSSSKFPGYYNYFNIYANTTAEYDANDHGLWFACGQLTPAQVAAGVKSSLTSYNRPWNTRQRSILGGTMYLGKNYILNGQNTLYLKKFNVVEGGSYSLYRHQFMSNIQAAYSEAVSLSRAYSEEARAEVLTFCIPVYENMPETRCALPTADGSPNNRLKSLSVDGQELFPAYEMNTLVYSVDPAEPVSSLTLRAEAYDATAKVEGTGSVALKSGSNELAVKVTAENGDIRIYTITVYVEPQSEDPTQESGESTEESSSAAGPAAAPVFPVDEAGFLSGLSVGMRLEAFTEGLRLAEGASAVICEAGGAAKAAGAVMKTGDTVVIRDAGGGSFLKATVLIYGDVNGDGAIKMSDLIKVRNHILETGLLSGVYKKAADVNHDGNVKMSDLIKVRNQILETGTISQS